MDSEFDHFVITRFNINQSVWKKDKNKVEVNTFEWLIDRYTIFKKYCLPSMQNQSIQNFKWLVYFDKNTNTCFKQYNTELHDQFPNFIPIYVTNFDEFREQKNKDIETYRDKNKQYIITTRLDNDDCLHIDAIAIIQKHFKTKTMTIIDLRNGLCFKTGENNKLSIFNNLNSGPFISLVEKVNSSIAILTVYHQEHAKWLDRAHFIPINDGHYWMQIIHERNVLNKMMGEPTFNRQYLVGYEHISKVRFNLTYYISVALFGAKRMGRKFKNRISTRNER